MTADFRALCVELTDCLEKADWPLRHRYVFRQWIDIARAALADGPAVPESREPASVTKQPSDEELALIYHDCCGGCEFMDQGGFEDAARAVLVRWGNPTPQPPADGEVAEFVEWLQEEADDYECIGCEDIAAKCKRAAELLQRQAQQTLPQGLIPMEYVDADSSARIVSEPSEDGPGGCWVVRNSRHVNPCTEFPTAEAAWDALQRARSQGAG